MWENNAYGGVFQARFAYVREKHGKKGVDDLLKKMKSRGYTGPMDPKEYKTSGKYPIEYLSMMLRAYKELHGEKAFQRMTRESAQRKGIVGFVIRWAMTPEAILMKSAEYYPNFFDFGTVEGEITGENSGRLIGKDVSLAKFFCQVMTQYLIGVFEGLRLKEFDIKHTECQREAESGASGR